MVEQSDKPTDEEVSTYLHMLAESQNEVNHRFLLAHIAVSLNRIASAQEALVEIARMDLTEEVNEAIESRGQERANEIQEERGKRSFIGKKAQPPQI